MRTILCGLLSTCVILLAGVRSQGQSGYSATNAFAGLTFTDPVVITAPPGETNRVFVIEQAGRIIVITNLASPTRTLFMDLTGPVAASGERGLLGMAFHPGYSSNRLFFCWFTTDANTDRLSRFETSATNSNQALAETEVIFINQPDDAHNHNGGDLHFGPDEYLYVSLGDEGWQNDQYGNSQTITRDFFSGILRIDVDKRAGNVPPNAHSASSTNYLVPADNPFLGATSFNGADVNPAAVRTEFWVVGLRNPWRFSFDPATGLLYCGDVGEGAREEINIIHRGSNYGWAFVEGTIAGPKSGYAPAGFVSVAPIFSYRRGIRESQGNSVTGGLVYRGHRIPQLEGHYVFADYFSGNVWAFHYDGTNQSPVTRILDDPEIATFGRDPSNGDILYGDLGDDQVKRVLYTIPSALERTLVPKGATWKYLDTGSDQSNVWRGLDFDDSTWASGPAELGYGETDHVTTVSTGPADERFVTTYFRHAFQVTEPGEFVSLTLDLLRDDGALVYLNDTLIVRSNMPAGVVTYLTRPLANVDNAEESVFFSSAVDPAVLRAGQNVLAVEIHDFRTFSTDVSFNLGLWGDTSPVLAVGRAGDAIELSWPSPAPGYFLESIPTLGSTERWTPVINPIAAAKGRASVTVTATHGAQFFRLSR